MQLIRTGFDGLDISYPLTVGTDVAEKLRHCRAVAESDPTGTAMFQHNELKMLVAASGARGGYAWRCDSGWGGPKGEVWFFKQPGNGRDEWGVRVSCRALPLALHGLARTRARIEATLHKLGLAYARGSESIGRVDVACDVLAPDLVPDRAQIVAHSASKVAEISDMPVQVVGRSGRVESITIGKNPNRQVVIYDKRAEVIATGKLWWWPIWDAALDAQGLSPLDSRDRAASAVWRVEIRAFKRHLKDRWSVTTWGQLREHLPAILRDALDDIRFTIPQADRNRARWPIHPLWSLARNAFGRDMTDLSGMVDSSFIDETLSAERERRITAQITGTMLSLAALKGVAEPQVGAFIVDAAERIRRALEARGGNLCERMDRARRKNPPCRFIEGVHDAE